jgi:hypothetical protein
MTIHKATDVNTEVLFSDAKKLGLVFFKSVPFNKSLNDVEGNVIDSIYDLGKACDELSRNPKVMYPSKESYRRYNVYKGGKVLGENLTLEEKSDKMKEFPKALVEPVELDTYNDDLDKYRTYQAMIRQTFSWGLYFLEDLLDNPKAIKAFSIAWEKGHSSGYGEVANEFSDLVDLIK